MLLHKGMQSYFSAVTGKAMDELYPQKRDAIHTLK
jgi:hypothetical protein